MNCRASSFNFSQYIQDNVVEAYRGEGRQFRKGHRSRSEQLGSFALKVMHEMAKIRGVADLGIFHVRAAQSQHQDRPRKSRPLWAEYR